MCGVVGSFDFSENNFASSFENIDNCLKGISHRGPDNCNYFKWKNGFIGNTRLSIIDLDGGNQPFLSLDKSVALVQNGEIYNYKELQIELKKIGYVFKSDSDSEVLLAAYLIWGEDFVQKLNGMFAISIYDKRTDKLLLYRDRVGIKPLFYYFENQRFLFGSEIKSFLSGVWNREINLGAVYDYLKLNYVPPCNTIFKDIFHVPPGGKIIISNGKLVKSSWWNMPSKVGFNKNINNIEEELYFQFDLAVKRRLVSDAPFGAFLSGGIDSSSVVYSMSKHLNREFETFTIGFDDPNYDESIYAKETSKIFCTNHNVEILDESSVSLWNKFIYHCDQPHGDVSFIPTMLLSNLASKKVKMVLTGDGGDELFAGYNKYLPYESSCLGDRCLETYIENTSLMKKELMGFLLKDEFAKKSRELSNICKMKKKVETFSFSDDLNKVLLFDFLNLLPGNNLVKPDRMGMAHSLEARTPYLDHNLVELAFSLPGNIKIFNQTTKHILKNTLRDKLGKKIVNRKKQMFTVPIGDWFKESLKDYLSVNLLSENSFSREICRLESLDSLIKLHHSGEKNYTRELRALVSLNKWHDIFIKDLNLDSII